MPHGLNHPTRLTLRDTLEEAERNRQNVTVTTVAGRHRGIPTEIGVDYIQLTGERTVELALFHVVAVER